MEEFQVKILASDHPFYEGKCYSLVIPTLRGMYGIHAHHSNMITAIIPGTLQYQIVPGAPLEAAVSNGLAKVENGEVLILVDTAERPEEIDANRARRDADAAKEAILQKKSIQEYRSATGKSCQSAQPPARQEGQQIMTKILRTSWFGMGDFSF